MVAYNERMHKMIDRREFLTGISASCAIAGLAKADANSPSTLKPGRYDVYLKHAKQIPPGQLGRFSRDTRVIVTHATGKCGYGFDMTRDVKRQFVGTYEFDGSSRIDVSAGRASGGDLPEVEFEFEESKPRKFYKHSRETLTAATLNVGDALLFRTAIGLVRRIELVSAHAEVVSKDGDWVKSYRFGAKFKLDGKGISKEFSIERETPSASNFAQPFEIGGLIVYLDMVQAAFEDCGGFLGEKDFLTTGVTCRPKRTVRITVQEVGVPICPQKIIEWFPGASKPHSTSICYNGYNTWAGPYLDSGKTLAHGGLDINMPSGTMLNAPIDFDDQAYFQSVAGGDVNNRWKGEKKWLDGTSWWLISNHLNSLKVPEHTPVKAGTIYAETAGVWVWDFEHTHFDFRIFDGEEDFWLDPWVLMRSSVKAD